MRALLLFGLSLSLLFGSACSDKEGILLNVSTNIERPIDRLEFVIGEGTGTESFSERETAIVETLDGRNLSLEPFKLFLRANAEDQLQRDTIVVAVRAVAANGDVMGFGHSDVLHFSPGEIREWSVEITTAQIPDNPMACLVWENGDNPDVQLATTGDQDCDGFIAGTMPGMDCNDDDSSVNPDAEETCTSEEDNNCDGRTGYVDADNDTFDACSMDPGQRDCNDNNENVFPRVISVCGTESIVCRNENVPFEAEGDPCYMQDSGTGECYGGSLICSADANGPPLVCNNFTGQTTAPGFCTPECSSANPNSCIPTEHVSCFINVATMNGSDGELCNAGGPLLLTAIARLPAPQDNCKKTKIAAGMDVFGWKLRLKEGPFDNCMGDAIEAIRDIGNMGPDNALMIIEQLDDNNDVIYRYSIDVTTLSIEMCNERVGLECNSEGDEDVWVALANSVPMD